ncbi:MAG: DNA polymerase, partial [Acidobacteriota bacterium]|nr:DNA polymerase [Acidobacteriota bacterium]
MEELNYRLVEKPEDVVATCEELARCAEVGFDTETTSLSPFEGRVRLVQLAAPGAVYLFDLDRLALSGDAARAEALEPLRRLLGATRPVKIGHNTKFDAKWVKHHLGVELCGDYDSRANDKVEVERAGLFDTLLASQLVSAGEQEDRHSLAVVAERYLGETVDKSLQVSDWGSAELSPGQLEYAARDAALMLPLRAKLVEALRANALTRTAQLEFECVVPLAALELSGVYLDQPCWRGKLKEIERRRDQLYEQLQDELAEEAAQQSLFGPTRADINLDSHVQLTRALTRVIGDPKRIPDSTRNWKLEPLAAEFPVVGRILEYRTLQKTLKFGETLLESVDKGKKDAEKSSRIHAHFHQIGAPTGRMSCTDPNVQQIPHAFDMRRCFRAPAGRKLVVADYSQIELRILADFTADPGFVEAFRSGADLHRTTAAQVFGVPAESVTKEQRDFAKRLNFGVVYGIGARRFALLTGLKETDAEDLLRRYFATYRGLDAWLREAGFKAVRDRTGLRTVAGRLFRFNFDPEDKQAASLAQRNGKNAPIQGCVNAGTRIFEKTKGYVPIEALVGEEVCVWDGSEFANARVASSGKKRLVRVTLWGGYYLECSPEHKFLTTDVNGRRRWRTPAEFVKGCWVALSNPVPAWNCGPVFPPLEVGKSHNASKASLADMSDRSDLGVWLGRLASDGSLGERQLGLLVAEHEEALLPEIKKLCEAFGHVSHYVGKGGKGPRRIHALTVSALGLCRQLNVAGAKSRIPDFAWQDSRLLSGYLRGMFDGDGTVTPDGPVLCFGQGARHLNWAREIQQALLLLGVRSRINICADRINVCVLKRESAVFARRIGFMNPLKQSKVEAISSEQRDGKIYGRAARVKSV